MRNYVIASLALLLILLGLLTLTLRDRPPTLPSTAPLYFKIESLEQISTNNNLSVPGYAAASGMQGAWGVLHVSEIATGTVVLANKSIGQGPTIVYADDGPGGMTGQITGIFYGLQTNSANTSTGGTIDLFWHATNATYVESNCVSGTTCSPDAAAVALFTSGTFLVRLKLANGVQPENEMTFTLSTGPWSSDTFSQSAFANVDTSMSGPWTAAMDADWFSTNFGTRDVRLMIVGARQSTWSGTSPAVGVKGADPITVFTH